MLLRIQLIIALLFFTFLPLNAALNPLLDYRMDECQWDGTTDEVVDSSSNGINATAKSGATIVESDLLLCRHGDFNEHYLEVTNPPQLSSSWSLSSWVKFPLGDAAYKIIASVDGKGDLAYFTDTKWGVYDNSGKIADDSITMPSDGWHHVAIINDGSSTSLYFDASLISTVSKHTDGDLRYIATSSDDLTGQTMGTAMDEFIIFDGQLKEIEISAIYSNQSNGLNYDGTTRASPCCCNPENGNLISNPSFEILCNSNIQETWNLYGGTIHLRDGLCGWNIISTIETWEDTTEKPASDGRVFTEIDGDSGTVDAIWQFLNTQENEYYSISFDYSKRDDSSDDDILVKWNDSEILHIEGTVDNWQSATITVLGTSADDKLSFEEPSSADDALGSWVDNIRVILTTPPVAPAYHFDAWDTFRDITDRNISTKVATTSFSLTLAALNEAGDNYQEFNGTVCSQVVDSDHSQNAKSSWVKSDFRETNTSTISFNVAPAVKNAQVTLVWKRDVDESCPLSDEDNSTLSSDNFAIRPQQFTLTPTPPYYAGETFTMSADADGIADYNETLLGGSFSIDANETQSACITATEHFTTGNAIFTNGSTQNFDANFTGIATYLNIKIHENNGSEFAAVDRDDTADSLRLITPHDVNISVAPYEINITKTEINASTGTNWIYMAAINDMNLTLHVTLQANNKQHKILKDFNASCYAQDVTLTLGTATDGVATTDMNYTATKATFSDGSTQKSGTLNDINQSMTIAAADFTLGVGQTAMALNVDRAYYNPLNPFKISGLAATITSATVAKEIHNDNTLNDGDISLYFARLKTADIKTSKDGATTDIEVEVYDTASSAYVNSFKQNSLNWYRYEDHTSDVFGDASYIDATTTTTSTNPPDFSIPSSNIANPNSGVIEVTLPQHDGRYILHVKTQPWLWYIPKDFGSDYSDAINSKCTQHPCLIYVFESDNSTDTISTGTFKGGESKVYDRGTYSKKGVKVFR